MKPQHLALAGGGRVIEITGIGHATYRGVADWYLAATVVYENGVRQDLRVSPSAIVYDGNLGGPGHREIIAVCQRLSAYLAAAGEWHEPKTKRDGRVYAWTPAKPAGEVDYDAVVVPKTR